MRSFLVSNPHHQLFATGSLMFSERIEQLVEEGQFDPMPFLERHLRGDWGDRSDYMWRENNTAVQSDGRLESFYIVHRDLAISIVTEADRSATCIRMLFER